MSAWKTYPSPAHSVAPDTPLSTCVRLMRDQGFGSLLIIDHRHEIVGIFTERDLLKRIDEIQHGGHWSKPVGLLMSRPVVSISIEDLSRADEIMLDLNIRHLPVVYNDSSGTQLTGVVSIRDLLRQSVRLKRRAALPASPPQRAGMIAQAEGIRRVVRKIGELHGTQPVETVALWPELEPTLEQARKLDYLFFDLDQVEAKTWIGLVKALNGVNPHPQVILIFDPKLHNPVELELLSKLALSKRFSAYSKPLNVFSVLASLH